MLKRSHAGTFHKMSPKHLQRYVNEFAGRHNIRNLDTLEQMGTVVRQMDLKRLTYEEAGQLVTPDATPPPDAVSDVVRRTSRLTR